MKILVFLHGTIIMHKNAAGKPREEIIQQVVDEEDSVRDFAAYIPIGSAPQKLQKWAEQGAEISYLSALTTSKKTRGDETVGEEGLKIDKVILDRYDFPEGAIYHREVGEDYWDVIERMTPLPDIMIEDDCASIGGESAMTHPGLSSEFHQKIKSIVVKEFGGIDHLPDDPSQLR